MANRKFTPIPDAIESVVGGIPVWEHFNRISQIPRGSGNEAAIRDYIATLSTNFGYTPHIDAAGNLLVRVGDDKGKNTVCLQSHLDMVCEKDSSYDHDFQRDPIRLVTDGEYITAYRTTLGADNGIGVAYMLELMTHPNPRHPNLELLFTVDEETGLTGASGLDYKLNSKQMINLDTEEDDRVIIGCAGGTQIKAAHEFKRTVPLGNRFLYQLTIGGLPGGHSGEDIGKLEELGHAITIGATYLDQMRVSAARKEYDFLLSEIHAGESENAIPRSFRATFAVPGEFLNELGVIEENLKKAWQEQYSGLEESLIDKGPHKTLLADSETSTQIIIGLCSVASGVYSWNQKIQGLPESSNNVGSIRTKDDRISVSGLMRSSDSPQLHKMYSDIEHKFNSLGFEVTNLGSYPGWDPNPDSQLLGIAQGASVDIYGEELKATAIHAGLECGAVKEKYPDMDIISIGPNIKHAHSPNEKVEIDSVERVGWLLNGLLERLATS